MKSLIVLLLLYKFAIQLSAQELNSRPIIGVLAQEKSTGMKNAYSGDSNSYIASSYVKFIESAGARVVPIMINRPYEYYVNMSESLNGIIFPGGGASISNTSRYGLAGQILYNLAIKADPPLPLFGICLGFEMLMYLGAGQTRPLTSCSASGTADALKLQPEWESSILFGSAPEEIIEYVEIYNTTANFHKWCVIPENFTENLGLNDSFKILSTTTDKNGLEYISTVEHRTLPIYGSQWHPEKPQFEWAYTSIPHTPEALAVSFYMANFFVNKAKQNLNKFSTEEEIKNLIYNYKPEYVAIEYKSSFQQIYLFED